MRDATERPSPQVELLDPLADYYSACGTSFPPITMLDATSLPEAYRLLLAHADDMTPTLEAFHGQSLELRVHRKSQSASTLQRTVSLVGCNDGTPVEFGAIRIELDAFGADVCAAICACSAPLGAILRDYDIEHHSNPTAFFAMSSDDVIEAALAPNAIPRGTPLYGRRNELSDGQGRPLAQVVEILPPLEDSA